MSVSVRLQDKQWICNAFKQEAKANNLDRDSIPVDLNPPDMSHFTADPLHKDGSTSLWQTTCHSWTSCDVMYLLICLCIRLPSQTQVVPMKLKRKLCYKGHYMYQYVRPAKVVAAQLWYCTRMTVTGSAMLQRMTLSSGRHCQQSTIHDHHYHQ